MVSENPYKPVASLHSCPSSTHGASGACGFGPYQLSTPVQGEKVGDNPGTDLPHLCASQKPEQTK